MKLNITSIEYQKILDTLWEDGMTGMALIDADGKFLKVNPLFCSITEYSSAELLSLFFKDITDPRDLKANQELAELTMNGELDEFLMNKRYITKKGKVVWVLIKVKPIIINDRFCYFLSQVSTALELDKSNSEVQEIRNITDLPSKILFFAFIKKNWVIITTIFSAIGLIIAEVIKALK